MREYRVAEATADLPQREAASLLGQPTPDEEDSETERDFVDVFPELQGLDSAIKDSLGFRIPTLLGVLAALASWPATNEDPAPEASASDLAILCEDSGVLSPEDIPTAIEFLTLTADALRAESPEPWEFARRKARLVTSPLPEVRQGLRVVMPWSLDAAGGVFLRYILQGRWPFPAATWPAEITRAADDYRSARNRELENAVEEALRASDYQTWVRIKPEDAARYGFTTLSGEIDVLAASTEAYVLWIVEAKDPVEAFSVAEFERHVRRFTEPDGSIDRLLRKVADVNRDCESIVATLALPDGEWVVRGLMVTRETSPAAFVPGQSIPFATLETVISRMEELHGAAAAS